MAISDHLEALYRSLDYQTMGSYDPIQIPHRYESRQDIEIAAFFAASQAFGKVSLFLPVLSDLCDRMDARGGPATFLRALEATDEPVFEGLNYRWTRQHDFFLLARTLQAVYADHDTMEALFMGPGDTTERLSRGITALRGYALSVSGAERFEELPRGTRYAFARPSQGSACKRWAMFFRWMVRPPAEGLDFQLWTSFRPADLVIPLDVHVGRISRLIGLTERKDTSWRTAQEVTQALTRFDPKDPLRFDFCIAHMGISKNCQGRLVDDICSACELSPICAAKRA